MIAAPSVQTELYRPPTQLTPEDLVAEAIRCIITGREFPEHLRQPSASSPGLASVQARIAALLAGPVGL